MDIMEMGVAGTAVLQEQIMQLANYIMANVEGEPSQSQGAVDTAIRIMSEQAARIAELEAQLAAAQERDRWHFELPPSRGRWYWCACGRFGGVQMSVYYTPEGTWNGQDVVAWRFLAAVPEPPEAPCD